MEIVSFHPLIKAQINSSVAGKTILSPRQLRLIKKADAIILPQICPEFLYQAVREFQKPCFPDQEIRYKCQDKASQIRFFQANNIPHPKTLIFQNLQCLAEYLKKNSWEWGFPLVLKSCWAHEGDGVFVLMDEKDFFIKSPEIENKVSKHEPIITQSLVPTKGYVLRIVTFYKELIPYWKVGTGPIISIAKGAKIVENLFPELKEKGINSLKELKEKIRIDLSAIDMIFDMEKIIGPLWLEINFSFGRKGLGGSKKFYAHLLRAVKTWLKDLGLSPKVTLWV